ncbi:hypothetical protein HMF7854_03845 [Sphingomonas ginkgonis]|uniref:Uncharacterized protein n=1 Tax=Sphingomonas ginkgonis TaxID=2315330 RepID=A0A3R9YKT8_9SPHN|nr:hypothetical protein [Sphingomonas ginkgonis]RST30054.1 hypothetical protein HMF7854_03845 [Sphingomonas ginkgonis]
MRIISTLTIAATLAVGMAVPAQAREGCGPGGHRGPYGHCRPNRGQQAWIVGHYYPSRGYWDGQRWYQHRYRYHNDWRYR